MFESRTYSIVYDNQLMSFRFKHFLKKLNLFINISFIYFFEKIKYLLCFYEFFF